MGRMRTIKPDYWSDCDVVELSPWARLLFIGLWNFADREGRLEDRPRQIKMRIFPADNVEIEDLLRELEGHFILRYEVDGKRCIQIRSWSKNQFPNRKEKPSEIPPFPGAENVKIPRSHVQGQVQHVPARESTMPASLRTENGELRTENTHPQTPSGEGAVCVPETADPAQTVLDSCREYLPAVHPSKSQARKWARVIQGQCRNGEFEPLTGEFFAAVARAGPEKPSGFIGSVIGNLHQFLAERKPVPIEPGRRDPPIREGPGVDREVLERMLPLLDELDRRDPKGLPLVGFSQRLERMEAWCGEHQITMARDELQALWLERDRWRARDPGRSAA